jgi:hypothetical protein
LSAPIISKKKGYKSKMSDRRASITDDSIINRWMNLEISKINNSIVTARKTLSQLLEEDNPSSKTKDGRKYLFKKEIINELGNRLPEHIQKKLKLPILFFFDLQVDDSCYINDKTAFEALQILGEIGYKREFRNNRHWMGKAIAYSIKKKYPSAVQIVMT